MPTNNETKVTMNKLLALALSMCIALPSWAEGDEHDNRLYFTMSDEAMDAAACIGCGACVAACKNGSAMLFVSAKVSQLALLPQGQVEAARRAKAMLAKMDELGFGNCTNTRACEAECPKCVSISNIARLNREFLKAKLAD